MAEKDPAWDETVRGKKMSDTTGMTIYKYPIISKFMMMPVDMEIIRTEEEGDNIWFWAIVDTEGPKVPSRIRMKQMPVLEEFELALPVGAKIIHVGDIGGKFFMWYISEVRANREAPNIEKEIRKFRAFKTGGTMPSGLNMKYLSLCKIYVQMELALYIFEDLT